MLPRLLDALAVYGPWLLFVMAALETSFITGLVVPSGVATSAATLLAMEGQLALPPVLLAAGLGGFVGDSVGFWIGRRWGAAVLDEESRWSALLGRKRAEVDALFGRHPLYSVTVARLVSFVRTVMPMAAGMSDMSYVRYLPYEVAGLLGWLVLYTGIGFAGEEGWDLATRIVGVGGTLAFLVISAVALLVVRRRRGAQRGTES